VFSFDPRCHGLCGSQKYTSILVANVKRQLLSPIPGRRLVRLLDERGDYRRKLSPKIICIQLQTGFFVSSVSTWMILPMLFRTTA
jgi:hypothetical protein